MTKNKGNPPPPPTPPPKRLIREDVHKSKPKSESNKK
jgi:hypothetical protein